MTWSDGVDEAAEAGGAGAEVIATTLEALQARIGEADREALRGAIALHRPLASGRENEDADR